MIANFGIYFSSNILNRAIPFVLLPIIARYLEPDDFGKLAIFSTAIIFMKPVLDLALVSFVTVEFYQQKKEYIASLNTSIITAIITNFFFVTTLFVGSRFVFGDYLSLPTRYYFLIPLVCLTSTIFLLNLIILRNNHKAFSFGLLQTLGTISNFSVSLLLIVGLKYNWEGRATAEIIANSTMALISIIFLFKDNYLSRLFSLEKLKAAVNFSLPLVASILFISMVSYVDRFFIKEMVSESALGIYSIGFSFGLILKSIIHSFQQVFTPWIYQHLSEKDQRKVRKVKLVKFTYLYSIIILILALGVGIGGNILLYLNFLPAKYLGAGSYIFLIALSFAIWGIIDIIGPYIAITKKTKYTLISTGLGCICNLILNYLFISWFGTIGAAYSKVVSVMIILVCYIYFANRIYPMPWFDYQALKISPKEIKEFLKIRK